MIAFSEVMSIGLNSDGLPKMERKLPEDDSTLVISFENSYASEQAQDLEAIREKIADLIQHGTSYLSSLLGKDFAHLSRHIVVQPTGGDTFHMEGTFMKVPIERIRKLINDPDDSYLDDLEHSQVVHELVHSIVDEAETLPMLAELMYIHEKERDLRIKQILTFINEGKLPSQYINGLQTIATWLGFTTSQELLQELPQLPVSSLHKLFKEKVLEYCQSEYAEAA